MIDISLCVSEGCPRALSCYRQTAWTRADSLRQSMIDPLKPDGYCDLYIPTDPETAR